MNVNNRLSDLNKHLFDQLDRLSGDLSDDQIKIEVERAEAISDIASQITNNANVMLKAAKLYADHGAQILPMLPQIGKASDE